MNSMNKSVVVITGAFGVLGGAAARLAVSRGARVALLDQGNRPPAEVSGMAGDNAMILGGVDLGEFDQAKRAMDAVMAQFGQLDVLLNIAGAFRWVTLADSTPAEWDSLFRANVQTAANASRAALDALKNSSKGRIVNIGAASAERAGAGMGAYAAAKAGVHRLTESLAEELKSTAVTVNAVLPSIIDTPRNRKDIPGADFTAWVAPDALANVILFLASEQASAVTGALVRVTGHA